MKRLTLLFLLLTTIGFAQPLEKDMQVFADRRIAFMEQMDRLRGCKQHSSIAMLQFIRRKEFREHRNKVK